MFRESTKAITDCCAKKGDVGKFFKHMLFDGQAYSQRLFEGALTKAKQDVAEQLKDGVERMKEEANKMKDGIENSDAGSLVADWAEDVSMLFDKMDGDGRMRAAMRDTVKGCLGPPKKREAVQAASLGCVLELEAKVIFWVAKLKCQSPHYYCCCTT